MTWRLVYQTVRGFTRALRLVGAEAGATRGEVFGQRFCMGGITTLIDRRQALRDAADRALVPRGAGRVLLPDEIEYALRDDRGRETAYQMMGKIPQRGSL